ncbi:MAG: hypothetical protein V3T11_06645 [Roseateles sp.]|nr:hypothetical protein [Burkholderiaceae bacterium]
MPADLQRALDTYAHALERAEWNQLKALLVEPPDKRGLAEYLGRLKSLSAAGARLQSQQVTSFRLLPYSRVANGAAAVIDLRRGYLHPLRPDNSLVTEYEQVFALRDGTQAWRFVPSFCLTEEQFSEWLRRE